MLVLIAVLVLRRWKWPALYPFALILVVILLGFNLVPSIGTMVSDRARSSRFDDSLMKTQFTVDESVPTPNVYWIHADGMLGFDAYEQYFGDAQFEFSTGLEARGFAINRSAMLEAGHITAIALPALMCPDFYDRELKDRLATHDGAMQTRSDSPFIKCDVLYARLQNELVNAFAQRGYTTRTLATYGKYMTMLVDRYYNLSKSAAGRPISYVSISGDCDQIAQRFMQDVDVNDLAELLLGKPSNVLIKGFLSRDLDVSASAPAATKSWIRSCPANCAARWRSIWSTRSTTHSAATNPPPSPQSTT